MKTKVLVVDDEKDFAGILSQRLEVRNFEVASVFSGEEAVRLIQEQDFDIILLDVLMPGQGGIATLTQIKTIKPLIHVIMLTGHASVATAIKGMELGAYDYLIKPMQIDELEDKIRLARDHKIVEEARLQQTQLSLGRRFINGVWNLISDLLNKAFKQKTIQPKKSD